MKKTTLENDTLAANTLIARLVSSEDLANLPGNKLDVYIDGTVQYEAFVRVGALPMPDDAKQGVFYVLPDNTVWFLDEAGNWETLHADSDKPDSIYKSLTDFAEGIGLEGTCDVSDIEDFDATAASTMIGNIFFYTVSGKIAVLEGISGDEITYRVLVSPSDGVNSWIVQVNSIPNASTLNTLDTLTIRWDNMNLIYDGQGNLVERSTFKNTIKLGENVYLQEAGGRPWAIGTMRSNNASELTLSIREDLRYSKNGFWVIRMNYANWLYWNTGIDVVSFGPDLVTDVLYYENGTQNSSMDAYDMLETAKLNQLVYCRDTNGQTRGVGLWLGPGGTDFRIFPIAVFADSSGIKPRNCWLSVDETQVNLDQLIDDEGTPFSLNIPAANTLAFSSVTDGSGYHQSGPYIHSSGRLKLDDLVVIADSNGVPRYQSTFRQYISSTSTIQVMLIYPFARDFQGKIMLGVSTTLDMSAWDTDEYVTIPYNSIIQSDYYTANSHSAGSGLEKYAKPGEPIYIYANSKAVYKAFVSEYDDTNNELRVFLTENLQGSDVDLSSLVKTVSKKVGYSLNATNKTINIDIEPYGTGYLFTADELAQTVGGKTVYPSRIEISYDGITTVTNSLDPGSTVDRYGHWYQHLCDFSLELYKSGSWVPVGSSTRWPGVYYTHRHTLAESDGMTTMGTAYRDDGQDIQYQSSLPSYSSAATQYLPMLRAGIHKTMTSSAQATAFKMKFNIQSFFPDNPRNETFFSATSKYETNGCSVDGALTWATTESSIKGLQFSMKVTPQWVSGTSYNGYIQTWDGIMTATAYYD